MAKTKMPKAKAAAAPAVPAAAKKKLKAAEKVAVKAQQKKVVGPRPVSWHCRRSHLYALPQNTALLCLPGTQGAALLLAGQEARRGRGA